MEAINIYSDNEKTKKEIKMKYLVYFYILTSWYLVLVFSLVSYGYTEYYTEQLYVSKSMILISLIVAVNVVYYHFLGKILDKIRR